MIPGEYVDMNESSVEMYTDGSVAREIEHLLVMRLHNSNTIQEIEVLKDKIHRIMENAYRLGEAREASAKKN